MQTQALVVDKAGLARKLANKPKDFILWELLQNALDENISYVMINARMVPGKPLCRIIVEDDCPDGFQELSSIYTLFKDSKKASDPKKRGRFELGEKLVIALAKTMVISTTKGTVSFTGDTRIHGRKKRAVGTEIDLTVAMTRGEYLVMVKKLMTVLLPPGSPRVLFNDVGIPAREPVGRVSTTLKTVVSDEEGALKHVQRKTDVLIYSVEDGEEATIYEMGIPVCRTGDKWHYDVQQRVPVNWERNSVPASYLKTLRVAALDEMKDVIQEEDASHTWVQSVLDKVQPETVGVVIRKQYGDKTVIADPSDPEGTKLAMSRGFAVIHGGAYSKDTWSNIKASGTLLPAGQVTPGPSAYSDDPDAPQEKLLEEGRWNDDLKRIAALTQRLGRALLDDEVEVRFTLTTNNFAAAFGTGFLTTFTYNYRRLGKHWFERSNTDTVLLDLILHEFGHYYSGDHLSEKYHDALTDLGARMTKLALNDPGIFKERT